MTLKFILVISIIFLSHGVWADEPTVKPEMIDTQGKVVKVKLTSFTVNHFPIESQPDVCRQKSNYGDEIENCEILLLSDVNAKDALGNEVYLKDVLLTYSKEGINKNLTEVLSRFEPDLLGGTFGALLEIGIDPTNMGDGTFNRVFDSGKLSELEFVTVPLAKVVSKIDNDPLDESYNDNRIQMGKLSVSLKVNSSIFEKETSEEGDADQENTDQKSTDQESSDKVEAEKVYVAYLGEGMDLSPFLAEGEKFSPSQVASIKLPSELASVKDFEVDFKSYQLSCFFESSEGGATVEPVPEGSAGDVFLKFNLPKYFSCMEEMTKYPQLGKEDRYSSLYESTFERLWGDLNQPFTEDRMKLICGLGMQMEIPEENVPYEKYDEPFFIEAVACAKPTKKGMLESLANSLGSRNSQAQVAGIQAFVKIRPNDDYFLYPMLALVNDESERVKEHLEEAMISLAPKKSHYQETMIEAGYLIYAKEVLKQYENNKIPEKILLALVEAIKAVPPYGLFGMVGKEAYPKASDLLVETGTSNGKVHLAITKVFPDSDHNALEAVHVLRDLKSPYEEVHLALMKNLNNRDKAVRNATIETLQNLNSTNEEVKAALQKAIEAKKIEDGPSN